VTRGGHTQEAIEGEVSTLPSSRVKVHADGKIEIEADPSLSKEDKILLKELLDSRKNYRKNRKQHLKVKKEEPLKKEEDEDEKMSEDEEEDVEVSDEEGADKDDE